jgi:cell wall-associated NlpC family hydrolase
MTRPLLRRLAACATAAGVLAGGLLGATPAEAAGATATTTAKTAIRSSAAAGGKVVGTLERGQKIPTTAGASRGWVRVEFRDKKAYVAAGAITTRTTRLPAAPKKLGAGTKIATTRLNVRNRPSSAGSLVGRIAQGSKVGVTGTVRTGYAQVRFRGKERWVSVRYLATATAAASTSAGAGAAAVAHAKAQLGKPYKFGATGPKSFDCSGLTLSAWKAAGVTLPRTSQQQFSTGKKVAKADLRPGDLVFFYGKKPAHVALYVGDGMVVHAPRAGKDVEYSKVAYMPFSGARRPG